MFLWYHLLVYFYDKEIIIYKIRGVDGSRPHTDEVVYGCAAVLTKLGIGLIEQCRGGPGDYDRPARISGVDL